MQGGACLDFAAYMHVLVSGPECRTCIDTLVTVMICSQEMQTIDARCLRWLQHTHPWRVPVPHAIASLSSPCPRGSPVRALTSSPALDIVGVGLGDGRAVLLNVRYDEVLSSFKNASGAGLGGFESSLGGPEGKARTGSACTAISFRTGACIARLRTPPLGNAPGCSACVFKHTHCPLR